MSKNRSKSKISALLLAIITVLAALAYLVFGEDIAGIAEKLAGMPGYGELVSIFGTDPVEGKLEVHIIDVDQADSILLRSSDGNILIDAGTSTSEADLKEYLDACGIKTIDYLICSHPHDDHIGGTDMIIDSYEVKNVLMTDMESTIYAFDSLLDGIEENNINAEIPNVGDVYTLGDIEIKILGPTEISDDANDMSLIVKVTFGDTTFMFTGDAEAPAEKALVSAYDETELDCDFYKVAHHGSNSSSTIEFLEMLSPDIAAISCGKENPYGHPRGEVLARLADVGCETILRTDKMGTIIVVSDGKELTVTATGNPTP